MSTYCVRDMLMRLKEVHSLLMQVYTAINPFGYSYISSCVHAKCVYIKKGLCPCLHHARHVYKTQEYR